MTTQAQANCENCGRIIGRLETAYVWNGHGVCSECHQRLNRVEGVLIAEPVSVPPPAVLPPTAPGEYRDEGAGTRVAVLIIGLFIWPVLLLWVILGAMESHRKSKHAQEVRAYKIALGNYNELMARYGQPALMPDARESAPASRSRQGFPLILKKGAARTPMEGPASRWEIQAVRRESGERVLRRVNAPDERSAILTLKDENLAVVEVKRLPS